MKLEIITFSKIEPEAFYSGGTTEETKTPKFQNAEVKRILTWYNLLTWIQAGFQAQGTIVHFQHWALYSSVYYLLTLPVLKMKNKKIVMTVHNITPHCQDKLVILLDKIVNKILFSFSDFFFVHNTRNKNRLKELYHINEKNIVIIPHGVLYPTTMTNISKTESRKKLSIPQEKKVILFFGYLWKYKGLTSMLHSLNSIKEEIPETVLLVAGEPIVFEKGWDQYEQMIQSLQLQNHVIKKLGFIPENEIEWFFSASDLVVLPYEEPFDTHGGVGALTLSFKKPLVVTDIGGLPAYVQDERVLVQPNNVQELSKKVITVLKDERLLQKLCKDTECLSKQFTWDKIAEKTIDVYQQLLQ